MPGLPGEARERVRERGRKFDGLTHAYEPKVTPLPGPLPIRASWSEGEEICAAVGHAFLTKWQRSGECSKQRPAGRVIRPARAAVGYSTRIGGLTGTIVAGSMNIE